LSKEFVLQALEQMEAEGNVRVTVTCPHCRRHIPVTKPELQRSLPVEVKK
jgi:hypothetical protein